MSEAAAPTGADISPYVDLFDDLYAECDGLLESARGDLLSLEAAMAEETAERVDPELLNRLFRCFHNLKGLAGLGKMHEAGLLAHQLENYLRILREDHVALSEAGMEALAAGVNALEELFSAHHAHTAMPETASVIALLDAAVNNLVGETVATAPDNIQRFAFIPSEALAKRDITVASVRERLQKIGQVLQVNPCMTDDEDFSFEFVVAVQVPVPDIHAWEQDGIRYLPADAPSSIAVEAEVSAHEAETAGSERPPLAVRVTEQPPAVSPEAANNRNAVSLSSSLNTMRVNMKHMDELMRIMGELVTSRAHQANHILDSRAYLPAVQWHALQETNTRLERQLRELREEVMRMRMVPISKAFERMRLVIRDLKAKTGKQVKLEVYGGDTELDKLMVERMMDPLLHLVRNALSHGIEDPQTRLARHKPAEGTITLRAYTSGDMVIIDVEDDGRGIDAAEILAQAGVPDAVPDMNRLLDVLCTPGFSTQHEVDEISGRGVGMDVVKSTVDALGGYLTLQTSPGTGTYFSVQLPMTLAIADALVVSVGEQKFAVPLLSVREVFEAAGAGTVSADNEHELLSYRGSALPLLRLARLFQLPESAADFFCVLVADTGIQTAGIVVDDILGNREIVVRALRDPLIRVPGITGAGEFSGGQIALILDINALIRGDQKNVSLAAPSDGKPVAYLPNHTDTLGETPYLLFKLAGSTYAIPSCLVQQVEMLADITHVPNVADFVEGVILSRGHVIPALNPRVHFGLEKIPHDVDTRLVVIDTGERTVGLVVDAATTFITLPDSAVQPPPDDITGSRQHYLEGIVILDDEMVFIPDIEAMLQ